eukprot:1393555-Pleurochrysis_carterae.AAC.2
MKYNRQLNPAYGVAELEGFMKSVQVVAWVASEDSEPHRAVPLWLIKESLVLVDVACFVEVQAAFLMIVLLFTFARSQTPCCKTYTSFDPTQHLMRPETAPQPHVKVRLEAIQQDPRMERSSAASGEDWIVVGDLANSIFLSS